MKLNEQAVGITSILSAYVLWGILPIYWKFIYFVPSLEILAHRVVWSFIFLIIILLIAGKARAFVGEFKQIIIRPKQLFSLLFASILISVNWLTYIWAVNNNHIIETSLGYYINPLVSVLFGIIILKERLSIWQIVSFILALIGVLNMTLHFGAFPWIALVLAVSFGLYGLMKKVINLGAIAGITSETLIITPFVLMYLIYIEKGVGGAFSLNSPVTSGLLMGAGIVTAVPLILFSAGAIRLPLSTVGFLQYVAPTIALILGVFRYHEPFTAVHLVSFVFIWVSLTIYSLSRTRLFIQLELMIKKKLVPGT
ncbi:MAG: EamA family transporter RarD [Desulfocucumaceae bacterium]